MTEAVTQVLTDPLLLSYVSDFTSTLVLDATCSQVKEARSQCAQFRLKANFTGRYWYDAKFRAAVLARARRPGQQVTVKFVIDSLEKILCIEPVFNEVSLGLYFRYLTVDVVDVELTMMSVRELYLNECDIKSDCTERFAARYPNLKKLYVYYSSFDLRMLQKWPALTHLCFADSRSSVSPEETGKAISTLGNLINIELGTELDLALVGVLPNVNVVRISRHWTNLHLLPRVFPNMNRLMLDIPLNNSLSFLADCENLLDLSVYAHEILSLPIIRKLKRLSVMHRGWTKHAQMSIIERIIRMEKLEMLYIPDLNPSLVPLIAQAKNLVSLTIRAGRPGPGRRFRHLHD